MNLSIVFTEENPHQPFVRVSLKEGEASIKLTRWVQFLSLLAYRRLLGIENGWVQREELCRLISFNGIEPKAIGRYLADTYVRFPELIFKFFTRYLNITTTGPYSLLLNSDRITTDLPKLEEYLSWIMEVPSPNLNNPMHLFWAGMAAQGRYEFFSGLALMKQFLSTVESQPNYEPTALAPCYFQIANILRLVEGNRFSGGHYIQKALKLLQNKKFAPVKKRIIIYANHLTANALINNGQFASEKIKLNNLTIEMIQANMKLIPDSFKLLFSCYKDNIYQSSIYEKNLSTKDFKHIVDLAKSRRDQRLLEIIEMWRMIIQTDLNNECISTIDLDWFKDFLNRERTPRPTVLELGWRLRKNLLNFKQLESASQLGQDCLLEFSNLHQTASYRNCLAEHKELMSSITPKMTLL